MVAGLELEASEATLQRLRAGPGPACEAVPGPAGGWEQPACWTDSDPARPAPGPIRRRRG